MKCLFTRLLMILVLAPVASVQAMDWLKETPMLQQRVDAGELPPIEQRIPQDVRVVNLQGDQVAGEQGGQMRMLMGKQKDIRQLIIYGYARLVGYTPELELKADILESYEVIDNRVFTLHLRKGHRWSDGHPFTSEDFRYYWEDIATNLELSKGGPSRHLVIDGQLPNVEYPDAYTVKYSWPAPNPYFLTALAGPAPLYIYKPAHYLRQFHARYQSAEALDEMMKKYGKRNWMSVHFNRDRPYKLPIRTCRPCSPG